MIDINIQSYKGSFGGNGNVVKDAFILVDKELIKQKTDCLLLNLSIGEYLLY